MSPVLSVKDAEVRFATRQGRRWLWSPLNHVHAVNGVSFDLNDGETLGIVGESGCGKSTLIRAVAGLTPLHAGEVHLNGTTVNYRDKDDLRKLRQKVQMIFQDPVASLNPRMTIREIVSEPLRYFRPELDGDAKAQAVRDILDRVGISRANFNRFPHEFSGGQCQRIGIARALVAQPKILLCDEPVSALDVSIQAQVMNLLKELQRDMGLALIFVAHDLGVVRHISDDVLVMYMGGVMEQAGADQVIATPKHPYTKALLSSVPVPDPKRRLTPQVLVGDLPSPIDLPQGCLFQSRCPVRIDACAIKRPQLQSRDDALVSCHLMKTPQA